MAGSAVALKLLRRDSVLRSTFLREFCVGRCVSSHPGLLQTLEGPLQTPRHFAFAQEYAPYGDLSGMLQEQVRRVGSKGPRTQSKTEASRAVASETEWEAQGQSGQWGLCQLRKQLQQGPGAPGGSHRRWWAGSLTQSPLTLPGHKNRWPEAGESL